MNARTERFVTLTRVGTVLALMLGAATPAAPAQSAFWSIGATSGGNWGNPANWQGGTVPSGSGNSAGFALDFTPGASVTLDGSRTIGRVISTSANPWSIDPGTGGTLSAASFIVTGGGPLTVTAPLAGTDFTKDGSGTLTVSNPGSAYTGPININAGTLKLVGSGNYSPVGIEVSLASGATLDVTGLTGGPRFGGDPSLRLNVGNGDTLDGTGTVSGGLRVTNGGTVYPGNNGVGALTVVGAGDFKSNSTWKVKLGTANPSGTNTSNRIDYSDELNVDSAVNMPIDGSGLTFSPGFTYNYIIATSGVSGFTTGNVNFLPTNFNPAAFASPAAFTLVPSGQTLILRFTPVPEPIFALAAFLGGVAGYGLLRRRRVRPAPPGTAP
jgi:autotransporter-associated beta strand protein